MGNRGFLNALGPGLLLAGAAVGVSHLVQSTRAGALYGFGLVGLVIAANLFKYPAFRFGPEYAAATGTSLLEGYRRQGRLALGIYLVLTLGTMFTVQAAVALLTAGLAKALFGLAWSPALVVALLFALCAALLAVGRYAWLDAINKVVVLVLTLSTLAATLLALPNIPWADIPWWPAGGFGAGDMLFAAALVGWMPSAIDLAVWHSLWTLARREQTGQTPTRRAVLADFHLGYWGAAGLALCFVILGAGVMYGRGVAFQPSAGGFAAQVIELYVATLGDWSRPLISVAAFACMFSTTFTVVDGFPRALSVLGRRFAGPEAAWSGEAGSRALYWGSLVVLGAGSVLIVTSFLKSLKELVDLATTLSFLTAPALAVLNHRAITGAEVPADARPGPAVLRFSLVSIVVLTGLALTYLWVRFGAA